MKWLYKKDLRDTSSIQKVEQTLGINFPLDYQKVILEHNGATASPNTINTSRQIGKAFGELLNFNLDSEENILSLYEELKNKIPEKVYPITMDPEGNFLCYDFRDDQNNPKLVRWDHEQKFIIQDKKLIIEDYDKESDYYHVDFVANSFTEVLAELYGEDIEESNSWDKFQDEEKLKQFSGEDLTQINRIRALQGLPPIEK
ncbi:SMI1/KNR4 family protein [Sphingobacterium sp. SRCM116780]|uniref:SMI1/KNR4 family protein n=1 Tax=Sphingobacterium sp. SRCM116780 TaxID=2907623 RepID=UPI001F187BFB|nr:SMI1/KNR4 family protein [Sphingobacterium sp. SRCM116780]UIR54678.1 SMI1/KNR4 family protein [Sphingobacterium sp. SRCM116780]